MVFLIRGFSAYSPGSYLAVPVLLLWTWIWVNSTISSEQSMPLSNSAMPAVKLRRIVVLISGSGMYKSLTIT